MLLLFSNIPEGSGKPRVTFRFLARERYRGEGNLDQGQPLLLIPGPTNDRAIIAHDVATLFSFTGYSTRKYKILKYWRCACAGRRDLAFLPTPVEPFSTGYSTQVTHTVAGRTLLRDAHCYGTKMLQQLLLHTQGIGIRMVHNRSLCKLCSCYPHHNSSSSSSE